jgi:putative flavoprotein involved in K+ transport
LGASTDVTPAVPSKTGGMSEAHDVIVIGAGQGGVAISHELTHAGREHIILERGRVGESWRGRWDSFTLVLPNWTVRLPGGSYEGEDPDGFMPRDAIVEYLSAYTESFAAPVREGITVTRLERNDEGFRVQTPGGDLLAREVVVATGGYQVPRLPDAFLSLEDAVPTIDSTKYRNPGSLPDGRVLIVGSGQTGCQLAEELTLAGRDVWLVCGKAPWLPRRVGGRDAIWWSDGTPFMNMTLADLPHPGLRGAANPQTTGRDGGHDLNYRTLQAIGVTLTGRLAGIEDGVARFAPDLAASVAYGDARYGDFRNLVRTKATHLGIPAPALPDPEPFEADAPESADLRSFAAAVIAVGYRPTYGSWIDLPGAFDAAGYPLQEDGTSTAVPGLHFMGVPFQRKRVSASLMGVGEDAAVLAEHMTRKPALSRAS